MRILLVPEDFRNDQYILRPLFQRLLRKLGKPRAKVVVCGDPLLGGVGEALKRERLAEIVERYDGMIDLFVLCVDRDGNPHRRSRLNGDVGSRRSGLAQAVAVVRGTGRGVGQGTILRAACQETWAGESSGRRAEALGRGVGPSR